MDRRKYQKQPGRKLVSFWASKETQDKLMDMVTSGRFSSRAAAIEALVDLGLSVGQVPNESLVELADLMERMSTLLEGHLQRLFFACLKDFIDKAEALGKATGQE